MYRDYQLHYPPLCTPQLKRRSDLHSVACPQLVEESEGVIQFQADKNNKFLDYSSSTSISNPINIAGTDLFLILPGK